MRLNYKQIINDYVSGLSISRCARKHNCCEALVNRLVKKAGVVRSRSEATKGSRNSNFGKSLSMEQKNKIAKSLRGKPLSQERRKNISLSCMGRIAWNKGKTTSEFIKKKISEARKGKGLGNKNGRISMLGKHHSVETRQKIAASHKGKKLSKEHRENAFRALLRALTLKPNKAEQTLQNLLNEVHPNQWQFVGDGKVIIEGFCPDFININGRKLIIELNGEYWHRNQEKEQRKIIAYQNMGYRTLIVWYRELRYPDSVKTKIIEFAK